MTTVLNAPHDLTTEASQCATFYLGNQLMGVDIQQVQEINRHATVAAVPHAPECVQGVINLRGEVVTVLDLRRVLGLEPVEITKETRNVIVNVEGEKLGLLVDRIADVVSTRPDQIEAPPANIRGVDGRFFRGVCKLESELLVILDVLEVFQGSREEYTR